MVATVGSGYSSCVGDPTVLSLDRSLLLDFAAAASLAVAAAVAVAVATLPRRVD